MQPLDDLLVVVLCGGQVTDLLYKEIVSLTWRVLSLVFLEKWGGFFLPFVAFGLWWTLGGIVVIWHKKQDL